MEKKEKENKNKNSDKYDLLNICTFFLTPHDGDF